MKKRFAKLDPLALREGAAAWLGERIELGPLVDVLRKKTVPIHRLSWIYLLGGAALFLFGLQVFSGSLLTLYYQPTEAAAHESVGRITTEVPYGWLIRSVHVWGAHLFLATVGLHLLTVLFTGAYRKPRELTWVSGVVLLFLALGFGFTGYLLPWNDLSYYATLVGTQIAGTLPCVGDLAVHFLRGGDQITGTTITRFFAAHVIFLPLVFGPLILVHLALIQLLGMSLPLGMSETRVREHRPFVSEYLLTDVRVWLLVFGAILTLAVLLPAGMGVKADPLKPAPEGIKPEWFFLFMFQTLKYVPERVGVAFLSLLALFLLAIAFLDRAAGQGRRSRVLTGVFLAIVAYVAVLEVLAILAPGVDQPREPLVADTYSLPRALVSLALLWPVIGFLVFYLGRFAAENARIRRLHRASDPR